MPPIKGTPRDSKGLQFRHVAATSHWDGPKKATKLMACLRGTAIKYVYTKTTQVRRNYRSLTWDGYPRGPEDMLQSLSVDAFLRGCKDRQAAFLTSEMYPVTLSEALRYLKSTIHNQKGNNQHQAGQF